MIQAGEYNWQIKHETDGTEIYQINLSHPDNDITVLYGCAAGNMTVQNFNRLLGADGDMFIFKIKFEETPIFIKALIAGENCTLAPLYHCDTVIKKSNK